jgi:hypothetical protein
MDVDILVQIQPKSLFSKIPLGAARDFGAGGTALAWTIG